jgi:hypothetical protein
MTTRDVVVVVVVNDNNVVFRRHQLLSHDARRHVRAHLGSASPPSLSYIFLHKRAR